MNWTDIAGIIFVCVTVNHMGLISAIEETIRHEMPVINCPKCLTFWSMVLYCTCKTDAHVIQVLAISLLSSYTAVWLELTEGVIDNLYNRIYDKIYPTTDTADDNAVCAESEMRELRKEPAPDSPAGEGEEPEAG